MKEEEKAHYNKVAMDLIYNGIKFEKVENNKYSVLKNLGDVEGTVNALKEMKSQGFEEYYPSDYMPDDISKDELVKEVIRLRHLNKENSFLLAQLQITQNDYKKCSEQRDEYKHQLNASNKEIAHLKERVNEIDSDVIRDLKDQIAVLKNDYAMDKHRYEKKIAKLIEDASWTHNEISCPWKHHVLDMLMTTGCYKKEHEENPFAALHALMVWESELGAYFEREKTLLRRIRRLWHHIYSWVCNTSNRIPPF